jgi:hypothetical protein
MYGDIALWRSVKVVTAKDATLDDAALRSVCYTLVEI